MKRFLLLLHTTQFQSAQLTISPRSGSPLDAPPAPTSPRVYGWGLLTLWNKTFVWLCGVGDGRAPRTIRGKVDNKRKQKVGIGSYRNGDRVVPGRDSHGGRGAVV